MSKVDIACGQFVLYPCSDGAPKTCQWMPLCSFSLSLLSLAKYPTMVLEKIHKIPSPPTVSTTYQDYQVYPATALCTWRIQNHQTTCHRVVLSPTLHQIIPPLRPLSSPPAVSGAPRLRCSQHPRRRPQREAAPRRRPGRCQPPSAAVSNLRYRRARRRPTCSRRNCNLWSEVRELHLFQSCIQR